MKILMYTLLAANIVSAQVKLNVTVQMPDKEPRVGIMASVYIKGADPSLASTRSEGYCVTDFDGWCTVDYSALPLEGIITFSSIREGDDTYMHEPVAYKCPANGKCDLNFPVTLKKWQKPARPAFIEDEDVAFYSSLINDVQACKPKNTDAYIELVEDLNDKIQSQLSKIKNRADEATVKTHLTAPDYNSSEDQSQYDGYIFWETGFQLNEMGHYAAENDIDFVNDLEDLIEAIETDMAVNGF